MPKLSRSSSLTSKEQRRRAQVSAPSKRVCVFLAVVVGFLWLAQQFLASVFTPTSLNAFKPVSFLPLPRPATFKLTSEHGSNSISNDKLAAILPVSVKSLQKLETTLIPLLGSTFLSEVIVGCPQSIYVGVEQAVRSVMSEANWTPKVSVLAWDEDENAGRAVISLGSQVSAKWSLLLDNDGMRALNNETLQILFHQPSLSFPIGPRGVTLSSSDMTCLTPSESMQPAAFLMPPFLVLSILLQQFADQVHVFGSWASLGAKVAEEGVERFGGLVLGLGEQGQDWCAAARNELRPNLQETAIAGRLRTHFSQEALIGKFYRLLEDQPEIVLDDDSPIIGVVLPSLEDLLSFSPATCGLIDAGYNVKIFLSDAPQHGLDNPSENSNSPALIDRSVVVGACILHYTSSYASRHFSVGAMISVWLDTNKRLPDVVLTVPEAWVSDTSLLAMDRTSNLSIIRISRQDLKYCDWMGTLTIDEWKNWNQPSISVSIITNDRPQSLSRLLSSLAFAHYFGDRVDVRINTEQTADSDTLRMVDNFEWNHGSVSVYHRVILGGLLQAVVESWYPHTNDSYGLILEDDIELSPFFYAWAKLSILRFRYGKRANQSPNLFGVSLYQQNNIELKPGGRQPFNARALFAVTDYFPVNTPYLSQIPCSWGAVYFPEHWREFHAYLSMRFAESVITIDEDIAPNLRSNKWTKSWKKYFIELAYLRGYLMLYPNYADFTSLSTNHLEVGSHVREDPKDVYDRKKSLFHLPLMKSSYGRDSTSTMSTGLLELPNGNLPDWSSLPVLDLTGTLTSEDDVMKRGSMRVAELTGCPSTGFAQHDARQLFFCNFA